MRPNKGPKADDFYGLFSSFWIMQKRESLISVIIIQHENHCSQDFVISSFKGEHNFFLKSN